MPDFFGIANAYRDSVANPNVGGVRTGSDELERTKGAARLAAKNAADQKRAQEEAAKAWMGLFTQKPVAPGVNQGATTANYAALAPRRRSGALSPDARVDRQDVGTLTSDGSIEGNKRVVMEMARQRGWTSPELLDALHRLVMKESGYKNTAQNPTSTAYGMFQFLNSTWGPYGTKTSDPALQAKYGLEYIARRYGDPLRALQFHLNNNWY